MSGPCRGCVHGFVPSSSTPFLSLPPPPHPHSFRPSNRTSRVGWRVETERRLGPSSGASAFARYPSHRTQLASFHRTARCKWSSNALCRTKRARLRAAGKVSVNNKCAQRVAINFRCIIYHLAVNRTVAKGLITVVEGKCLTPLRCVNLHYLWKYEIFEKRNIVDYINTKEVSRILVRIRLEISDFNLTSWKVWHFVINIFFH